VKFFFGNNGVFEKTPGGANKFRIGKFFRADFDDSVKYMTDGEGRSIDLVESR